MIFQILTPIIAMATAAVAFTGRRISHGLSLCYRGIKNLLGRIVRTSGSDLD
jgi:hypothetical protein